MKEVFVRFSGSEVSGVVPVGTYVVDCFARFGFRPPSRCSIDQDEHHCKFAVVSGSTHLSEPTETEMAMLARSDSDQTFRLGCQTFFSGSGEVEIKMEREMEAEIEVNETKDNIPTSESYREAFAKLPLEKKIADLLHLEAVTFNETISYVVNSPYTVFDKILDVFSELGLRKESEEKAASRPLEHREEPIESSDDKVKGKKVKPKKRSSAKVKKKV
jgi:ferredoxin